MKSDKPSRNEDEYFARADAELMRKQRERAQAAHEDRSNVLTRVLSDALSTFRLSSRSRRPDKPTRQPGNPHK
jgi:hypothetical protein